MTWISDVGDYRVMVESDDIETEPHVHVIDAKTMGEEFNSPISLVRTGYVKHIGEKNNELTTELKEQFNDMLFKPSYRRDVKNNYEMAMCTWIDFNEVCYEIMKEAFHEIPDYSKL
jgi:hypothetical protein